MCQTMVFILFHLVLLRVKAVVHVTTVTTMLLITIIICFPSNPLVFFSRSSYHTYHTVMYIKAGLGLLAPYHVGNKCLLVCVCSESKLTMACLHQSQVDARLRVVFCQVFFSFTYNECLLFFGAKNNQMRNILPCDTVRASWCLGKTTTTMETGQ